MEEPPEHQEQPVYPQPYQQPYPYYPYQPPKKDDKKLMIVLVVVVILAIVLPVILSVVLYFMVVGVVPDGEVVPTGVWGPRTVVSPTEVWVDFGKVNPEPRPVELTIVLVRNHTD